MVGFAMLAAFLVGLFSWRAASFFTFLFGVLLLLGFAHLPAIAPHMADGGDSYALGKAIGALGAEAMFVAVAGLLPFGLKALFRRRDKTKPR
jgi:hypothetical protein